MNADQKNHNAGHRARLRERFLRDPHNLPDYELLELHLGHVLRRCDTKALAKDMLARFGSLAGVLDAREDELRDMPGAGPAVSAYLVLFRELAARSMTQQIHREKTALSLDDIGRLALCRLAGCTREEVWAALLDKGNRLLIFTQIGIGSVGGVLFSSRDIMARVMRYDASGVVLVHNHPGGAVRHSSLDLEATDNIAELLSGVDVRLLDHLILADGKYYSLPRDRLSA